MTTKRTMRWLSILVLCLAAGFAAYRAHYREVVRGSILGLTIGESKEEILADLQARGDVTHVAARVPYFVINHKNIDALPRLRSTPSFLVQGRNMQVKVEVKGSAIEYYSHMGVGNDLSETPENLDTFLPQLRDYLLENTDAGVIPIANIRGGGNSDAVQIIPADTVREKQIRWLMDFDQWGFKLQGRWVFVELFFEDDRLTKVIRQNDFIELP
jgi:hypothetical protein